MYKCNICDSILKSVISYQRHLYIHRFKTNVSFMCLQPTCSKIYSNYYVYKTHTYRHHNNKKNTIMWTKTHSIKYECSICHFKSDIVKIIVQHLNIHLINNIHITCPFTNCSKIFATKGSFKSHLFRTHKADGTKSKDNILSESQISENVSTLNDTEFDDVPRDVICRNFANLIITLKCKFQITDTALNFMVSELEEIFKFQNIDNIKNITELCKDPIISKYKQQLINATSNFEFASDISNFNSHYKRSTYFKNKFNYVAPREIFLGFNECHKKCSYHYIPILQIIKALMSENDFSTLFHEEKPSRTMKYRDYNDGSFYKNNIFFNGNDKRIELLLFQDAFENCNPLGSSKKNTS